MKDVRMKSRKSDLSTLAKNVRTDSTLPPCSCGHTINLEKVEIFFALKSAESASEVLFHSKTTKDF